MVFAQAAQFFTGLDQTARDTGVVLGIEPVSNIWVNGRPIFGRCGIDVVRFTDMLQTHYGTTNVGFVPDTFAMYDTREDPAYVLDRAVQARVLAPHMQIAEAGMTPHSPDSPINHRAYSAAFRGALGHLASTYPGITPVIAIEMKPPEYISPFDTARSLSGIVQTAQSNYATALQLS